MSKSLTKTKTKNTIMNQSYCSPFKESIFTTKNRTCYSKEQLVLIARQYNKAVENEKRINSLKIPKNRLLSELHFKLDPICNYKHESCWIDLNFMNIVKKNTRRELMDTFRPIRPDSWKVNDRTWLNTYDIMNVLHQYEKKYPSFKFLGVHPINFDQRLNTETCVSDELCNLNVRTLLRAGYKQVGTVFNLDRHDEPGSHWVCFYSGLTPNYPNFGCYFIDSNSTDTPQEVRKLMYNIKQQIKGIYNEPVSRKFNTLESDKQFQFKNTECGMFSMYFIIKFLEKKKFNDILNVDIDDDDVHQFRDIYYRKI